jgi:hypothetical protein
MVSIKARTDRPAYLPASVASLDQACAKISRPGMRAASFVVRSDHSRPLVNCLQAHPLFQQLTETWDSEWLAIPALSRS